MNLFSSRPKGMPTLKVKQPKSQRGRGGGLDPAIQQRRLALQSERLALQKKNAERNWAYKLANFERMVGKANREQFLKFHSLLAKGGRPKGTGVVPPRISLGGAVDRLSKAKAQITDHIGKALDVLRGSGLPTEIAQSVGRLKKRGGMR